SARARRRFRWPPLRRQRTGPAARDEAAPFSRIRELISREALEAGRLPVVASVAGAQSLARLLIHGDAFGITPESLADVNLVAHVLENVNRVRRETDRLHLDLIGHPLVVEARRIHRFLDV